MVAAHAVMPSYGASRHHNRAEICVFLHIDVIRVVACTHASASRAMHIHVQVLHNAAVGTIALVTCTSTIVKLRIGMS